MTRCLRTGDAVSTSLQQTLENSSSWEHSLQNSAQNSARFSLHGNLPALELGNPRSTLQSTAISPDRSSAYSSMWLPSAQESSVQTEHQRSGYAA